MISACVGPQHCVLWKNDCQTHEQGDSACTSVSREEGRAIAVSGVEAVVVAVDLVSAPVSFALCL